VSLISPTGFAVCGGIGIAAAFVSAIVGYQLTENALSESGTKIAEANARQKEAELKLEQLRKLAGPRGINSDTLKKELAGKPKAPVFIWYLPDSSDGYWFATRLFGALWESGWRPERPVPMPDLDEKVVEAVMPGVPQVLPILRANPRAMNAGGQPSGVTVVGDAPMGTSPDPNADTPFNALFNALAKSTDFGMYGSGGSQFSPVPKGTLRVVIAAKSDPMFNDIKPRPTNAEDAPK
jgi:hypothetical protein